MESEDESDLTLANTLTTLALVKVMEAKGLIDREALVRDLRATAESLMDHEGDKSLAPVGKALNQVCDLMGLDRSSDGDR